MNFLNVRIEEKRTLLNNIPLGKANWIIHVLRRNCLFYDAIERQMTEQKGIGGIETQLFDKLRNKRRYRELTDEMGDNKRWKRQFMSSTQRRKKYISSLPRTC